MARDKDLVNHVCRIIGRFIDLKADKVDISKTFAEYGITDPARFLELCMEAERTCDTSLPEHDASLGPDSPIELLIDLLAEAGAQAPCAPHQVRICVSSFGLDPEVAEA